MTLAKQSAVGDRCRIEIDVVLEILSRSEAVRVDGIDTESGRRDPSRALLTTYSDVSWAFDSMFNQGGHDAPHCPYSRAR